MVALMVGRVRRCAGTDVGARRTGCTGAGSSHPLQHADLQGVCAGRDVDPLVGQHHEDQRDVEGHQRAGEGVWLVDHEDTGRGIAAFTVAPLLNLVKEVASERTVRQEAQVRIQRHC